MTAAASPEEREEAISLQSGLCLDGHCGCNMWSGCKLQDMMIDEKTALHPTEAGGGDA